LYVAVITAALFGGLSLVGKRLRFWSFKLLILIYRGVKILKT